MSRIRDRQELGLRVSELLTGAWRDSAQTSNRGPRAGSPRGMVVPVLNLSEAELTDILPLLCESGAGALGWWRIRNTPLANSAAGGQLHEVYRRHRLSALIHEREIAYVLSLLRAEGIEPVLVKGWAIARLYPDAGLRPYGDIDLCVRPDQFAQASAALECLEEIDGHQVDLHCGFTRIGQTKPQDSRWEIRRLRRVRINQDDMDVWDELFDRSQVVPLAESKVQSPKSKVMSEPGAVATGFVRILCDEDHLRLLSLHLLRSGARRPPWLCDVGLLVESLNFASRAKDFRWDVCRGQGSDRTANRNLNWIATTIGLAHHLLGADVSGIANTILAERVRNLPHWLMPAVLSQWGGRRVQSPTSMTSLSSLYSRWDNPVRATAAVGGQFNNWPRLPYRVAELVTRLPEVPRQLVSLVEQFAVRPPPSEVRSGSPAGPARWLTDFRLTEE